MILFTETSLLTLCIHVHILIRILTVNLKNFFLIRSHKITASRIFLCHYQSVIVSKKKFKILYKSDSIFFLICFFCISIFHSSKKSDEMLTSKRLGALQSIDLFSFSV